MAYTTIDDPSAYFQIALWTGDGTAGNAVTFDGNSDMQPDFVWSKRRDSATSNVLKNTSAGGTSDNDLHLVSDLTQAESTYAQYRMDFDSDGFTLDGVGDSGFQGIGTSMVSWSWKANGGTTSSNTAGSTTTTVQVNQDAGFSIVTYLGNGNAANQTLGHGLGVAPDMIISKRRGASTDWLVYHKSLGVGSIIYLNSNVASSTTNPPYKDTPTSTVFSTQYEFQATDNWVSYCFAEKQGYSKFGSYVGNGNSNGPFVYTGFKPAFVIVKRIDSTGDWVMYDSKRNPSNVVDKYLMPHNANAEATASSELIDFLSNGFKVRGTWNGFNASGGSIIYMAFAENPFVTSTGIMGTAR